MVELFFKYRNFFGIILILGPSMGSFSADMPFPGLVLLLTAAAAAVPLHCMAVLFLPFRLWLFLCCSLAAAGLQLPGLFPDGHSVSGFLWILLLFQGGSGSGLLLLPPFLAFRKGTALKASGLGFLWSGVFLSAGLWQLLQRLDGFPAGVLALFCGAAGILLIDREPAFPTGEAQLYFGGNVSFARPAAFIAVLGSSMGILLSLAHYDSAPAAPADASLPLISFLLLAASPLFASLLMERKGIFSGSILLIFLCEAAAFCFSSALQGAEHIMGSRVPAAAGCGLLAAAAGCLPVVLPVLSHYLCGGAPFPESFSRLIFFLPAGLLAAMPICYLTAEGEVSPDEPVIFLLCLLVLDFFCIFSAWKHRFVILKNDIL